MDKDYNNIKLHLVHSHDVQLDTDYTMWLVELKSRYRSAQLKAAVRVNGEKLLFNWQLGRDLVIKKAECRWGAVLLSSFRSICNQSSRKIKVFLRVTFGI